MKARVNWKPSKGQNKVITQEVNKQIVERMRNHENDFDALILYLLHKKYKFGKKRLKDFYDSYSIFYDELIKYYELSEDDKEWIAKRQLKEELGIDLNEWRHSKEGNNVSQ